MIVQLSFSAGDAVMSRVTFPHSARMRQFRRASGTKAHNYELPANAWRQVLDQLIPLAFGPRGGVRKDIPQSAYTACKRIQAAVAMREHHPALRGEGVGGIQGEVIPVWEIARPSRARVGARWSPYPVDGERMMLLIPRPEKMSGHDVTTWMPTDVSKAHPSIGGRYSLTEAANLEFAGRERNLPDPPTYGNLSL